MNQDLKHAAAMTASIGLQLGVVGVFYYVGALLYPIIGLAALVVVGLPAIFTMLYTSIKFAGFIARKGWI